MTKVLLAVLCACVMFPAVALSGSPHFTSCSVEVSGDTLTFDGKEAGLGNVPQVHIALTATAVCINPGGNHPKAVNKTGVAADADVPVQNGKALFSLEATATFSPDCSPPMTVEFQDIQACDTDNNVCCSL